MEAPVSHSASPTPELQTARPDSTWLDSSSAFKLCSTVCMPWTESGRKAIPRAPIPPGTQQRNAGIGAYSPHLLGFSPSSSKAGWFLPGRQVTSSWGPWGRPGGGGQGNRPLLMAQRRCGQGSVRAGLRLCGKKVGG